MEELRDEDGTFHTTTPFDFVREGVNPFVTPNDILLLIKATLNKPS